MLVLNANKSELLIHGAIGETWFDDGNTAENVIKMLDQMDGKRVSVRINSPGGAADEGIAIYNALKRHNGGVDTYNDALAASAASIVFLAGENRYASEGSRVMIHRAITIDIGNTIQFKKTAAMLAKYDESLIEIYGKFMKQSPDAIAELLTAETWYTSNEAVNNGLATALVGETREKPEIASWFRNPPAQMLEKGQVPVRRIAAWARAKRRQYRSLDNA